MPVCDNDRRHYPSKVISFRSFKNLNEDELLKDLSVAPWHVGDIFDSVDDRYFYWSKLVNDVLDNQAPSPLPPPPKKKVEGQVQGGGIHDSGMENSNSNGKEVHKEVW